VTVTIKRIGGSVAVVIPKSVAHEMQLTDGVAVDLTVASGALIMRKQGRRPRRPLARLVEQIKPTSYRRRNKEINDSPIGRELW
jgi:antitoxin component of MazEF toxin-antitoxin module